MLTWGADRAVLVLKKETGDISHSAKLLAGAIEAEDMFDIILCGRQAIDGDAAHMAAMTAFFLKIPLIAYSKKIKQWMKLHLVRCRNRQRKVKPDQHRIV